MGTLTWSIIALGVGLFVYREKIFKHREDKTVGLTDEALKYIPENMRQYIPPDLFFDAEIKKFVEQNTPAI